MSLSRTNEFKAAEFLKKCLDLESFQIWAFGAIVTSWSPALQKKIFLLFIGCLRSFSQRKALGLGNNPVHTQIDDMAEILLAEYDKRGGM